MTKALIIEIDEFKPHIKGYDPKFSSNAQSDSAKLANQQFDLAIKEGRYKKVILMGGGSASGKTEFVRSHLFGEEAIIFDSTLSTVKGANIKIKKCLKRGLEVEVCFVFPDDLYRAYVAFKNRERVIPDQVFVKTHTGSRKTLMELINNFPGLRVSVFKSYYMKEVLKYNLIALDERVDVIEYIKSIQLTAKELDILLSSYERDSNKRDSSKTEKTE